MSIRYKRTETIPYIYYDAYKVGRTAILEIDAGIVKFKVEFPCICEDAAEEIAEKILRRADNLKGSKIRQFIRYILKELIDTPD